MEKINREKKKIGLISSYVMCVLALLMPFRMRIVFTFLINFIYNSIFDTMKIIISLINKFIIQVLIFIVYFLVIGCCSLIAKLFRQIYIYGIDRSVSSYFLPKEDFGNTPEQFKRQF